MKERYQIEYPLDQESIAAMKQFLEDYFPEYKFRSRKDALTIPNGDVSFRVTSNYMVLTGAAAVTIATIVGGYEGQILTLEFTDANVTITDDATAAANTVNLSAAFTSTANDTMRLLFDGVSWREISRSVN